MTKNITTQTRTNMIAFFLRKLHILPVDFNKEWWRIIWDQRGYACIVILGEIITTTFNTLTPLLLGLVFARGQWDGLVYLFIVWALVAAFVFIARQYNSILQLRCIHSIHFNAHEWFLRIDPIYHARRESGTILGKIDQSSRAYDDLMDELSFEILPTLR